MLTTFDLCFWTNLSQGSAGRWVLPLHLIFLPQPGRVEDHKNTGSLAGTEPYVLASLKRAQEALDLPGRGLRIC